MDEFPILLSSYFVEYHSKDTLEIWIQGINQKMIQKISFLYKDMDVMLKMKRDMLDTQEWKKLFSGILGDIFEDKNSIKQIVLLTFDESKEYQTMLKNGINRVIKSAWKTAIKRHIDSKKSDIREEIKKFDSYWSGKIVAEAIRKFVKEEADAIITTYVDKYILSQGKEIIVNILVHEIYEQKELVIKEFVKISI